MTGDEAVLQVEYRYADGSTPTGPRRYVRMGNEWRQALDFDAPSVGKMRVGLSLHHAVAQQRASASY